MSEEIKKTLADNAANESIGDLVKQTKKRTSKKPNEKNSSANALSPKENEKSIAKRGAVKNPELHKKHRERVKERFLKSGLDSFNDHQALELLLFYARPYQDVNEIAHTLCNYYGSLLGVFQAEYADLLKREEVSTHTAILLKLIPELARRIKTDTAGNSFIIDTVEKAGQYLINIFDSEKTERVIVVSLDSANRLLGYDVIGFGTIEHAFFYVRLVVEAAITKKASSVILSHNHLSGIALPSEEDRVTTLHLKNALENIGIRLTDHIIVAGNDFVSLAQSGCFEE